MWQWKRWLLLIVLLAGVTVGPYLALRRGADSASANRHFPPTTRFSDDQNGTLWAKESPSTLAGAGLLPHGAWWTAEHETFNPRLSHSGVAIGDVAIGKVRRVVRTNAPITGWVVAQDGVLYAPTGDSHVTAIDLETREVFWEVDLGGKITGLLLADGQLLAPTERAVFALDPGDGQRHWAAQSADRITTRPGAGKGFVCFGTAEKSLVFVEARSGKPICKVPVNNVPTGTVSAAGETVYVCTFAGLEPAALLAINARERKVEWKSELVPPIYNDSRANGPVLAHDTIYLTYAEVLSAVDAHSGRERWRWSSTSTVDLNRNGWKSVHAPVPSIGTPKLHNGLVYFTWETYISALDEESGREIWRFNAPKRELSKYGGFVLPPIVSDDMVFAALGPTVVFAVKNDAESVSKPGQSFNPVAIPLSSAWMAIIGTILGLTAIVAGFVHRWRAFVVAVCLVLCVMAVWSWFASYQSSNFIGQNKLNVSGDAQYAERTLRGITAHQGSITLGGSHAVWETTIRRKVLGDSSSNWWATRSSLSEGANPGDPPPTDLGMTRFAWTHRSRWSGTSLGNQSEMSLTVPHWLVVLILAVLPFAWLSGFWRDRRRYPKGHCAKCGYDLRASKDVCPECGQIIPASRT